MSQIARSGGGGGAAGVFTLSGDGGVAVNPDGAGNIDINGAGGITVTSNPGTNSLTITNNVIATDFVADDGNTALPALGILNIFSGANISTTAAGNTITIHLDDNVTIIGTFTADIINAITSLNSVGDITTTLGDITAVTGNLEVQAGLFHANVDMMAGAEITGVLQLHSLGAGAMQTTAAGVVFSDNGVDGQVLIGGGAAPAWANLTAGPNIIITNAANSITISADIDLAAQYNADAGIAVPAASVLQVFGGANVHTIGAGNTLTIHLNDSIALVGSATVGTTLTVAGITTLNGALQANGTATVVGPALFQAAVAMAANLTVNGNVHIVGTSALDGAVTAGSTLAVGTNLTVGGTSTFTGNTTLLGTSVLTLTGRNNGALVTGATGIVSASNGNPTGTNGQLLVSGPVAPAWHALESADGTIAITYPGANRINLSTVTAVNYGFSAYLNTNRANVTGDWTLYPIVFNSFEYNDGFYNVVTGIYTVPFTARYMISGSISFYNLQATNAEAHYVTNINGAPKAEAFVINPYPIAPLGAAPFNRNILQPINMILSLTAGQQINFALTVGGVAKVVGVRGDPSARRYTWIAMNILR